MRGRWALLALLCGCVSETTGDPSQTMPAEVTTPSPTTSPTTSPPAASVEVGIGASDHTAVEAGDDLPITFGPQGGWHVDVCGLVDADSDIVWVAPWVQTLDGELLAGDPEVVTYVQLATDPATGEAVFVGQRAGLDFVEPMTAAALCEYADGPVELCVDIGLPEGEQPAATDCVELILRMDPGHPCP